MMETHKIVKKIIGNIRPVGATHIDGERFENLKETCLLVELLLHDINDMIFLHNNDSQFSVKRSVDYAREFILKK